MIEASRILGLQGAALSLQRQRLELIAGNLANADTPGFLARDLDFRAVLQALESGGRASAPDPLYRQPVQPSADGNTVDMQVEQAAYADAALRYQASLSFIDGRIKSMLTALSGQ